MKVEHVSTDGNEVVVDYELVDKSDGTFLCPVN